MSAPIVTHAQLKRAETTSSIGAGVLGAGLGLLMAEWLAPHAVLILLAGLLTHVWGMYDKHRLEARTGAARLWWADLLYWGCWLGLLGMLAYLLIGGR